MELGPGQAATGHVSRVVTFRNTSASSCTLYGYPGMQMLDAAGQPIATHVQRGGSYTVPKVPERSVTLPPGGAASFTLGYADATGYGGAHCPRSTKVEITPPNAYHPITIAWQIQPYGGPTIKQLRCGEIAVSPVYPGAGRASQSPPRVAHQTGHSSRRQAASQNIHS